MEKRFLAALTLVGVIAALALPAGAKSKPHVRMKQYTSEHGARLHRHRAHQPAQRHARMQRYAAGHRARQHLKAQRQGE